MATVPNKDRMKDGPDPHLIPPRRLKVLGGAPPTLPAPTITITSLSPNTAPRNTMVTIAVLGSTLTAGDVITFGSGVTALTQFNNSGQVTTREPVNTGTSAQTVQVWLTRGAAVSNQLPFTVT